MLREAKIILPVRDNDGVPVDHAHKYLHRTLISRWGGYTAVEAQGAWASHNNITIETVVVYSIACEDTAETENALAEFAATVGVLASQDAIYLVLPSGRVKIIETANTEGG